MRSQARPVWQIHLGTAVLLALVIGMLIGLNVTRHVIERDHPITNYPEWKEPCWACGWPLNYQTVSLVSYKGWEAMEALQSFPFHRHYWKWPGYADYSALWVDGLVMFVAALATVVAAEFYYRRRSWPVATS